MKTYFKVGHFGHHKVHLNNFQIVNSANSNLYVEMMKRDSR